jgi:hypothetical protein
MNKLNINNGISFIIVDSLKVEKFAKFQTELFRLSEIEKKQKIDSICDLLLSKINILDSGNSLYNYEKYYEIYDNLFSFQEMKVMGLRDADFFLKRIRQSSSVSASDFGHLMHLYFYQYCVVSFGDYWYMRPSIIVSDLLANGAFSQSLFYKDLIHLSDKAIPYLSPVDIGGYSNDIKIIKPELATELLGMIMKIPFISEMEPVMIEINYYLFFRESLIGNSNYNLVAIFSQP